MDDRKQENGNQPPEIGTDAGSNEKIDRPSTEVKSITNIYYDCLERIYDFLDLGSLLNVAGTCKRLQMAAAAYFGDVYGERRAELYANSNEIKPGIRLNEYDGIVVNRLKFCLPFLRCFGTKISHLEVHNLHNLDGIEYIHRYINQYCAKTLKTISFNSGFKFAIENFPNPFECVLDVGFGYVKLVVHLQYLCYLYPNLRNLTMRFVSIDENLVDIQFSNLKKLSIWIEADSNFTVKSLQTFLLGSPQLQNLNVFVVRGQEMAWNELLNTIKGNPSITKLGIQNGNNRYISQTDLMRFASELPYIVELNFGKHRIAPQNAVNFIRQLKSLKMFRFLMNSQAERNELVSHLDSEWKHEYTFLVGFNIHAITLTR